MKLIETTKSYQLNATTFFDVIEANKIISVTLKNDINEIMLFLTELEQIVDFVKSEASHD